MEHRRGALAAPSSARAINWLNLAVKVVDSRHIGNGGGIAQFAGAQGVVHRQSELVRLVVG